ncbi:hypothetical protein NVI2019_GHJFPKLH_03137 [Providencia alcalifaciens]|nr:hypothetical protein NVI2019_GHJFPKLH_03137 [Providencia alcalifaciens]
MPEIILQKLSFYTYYPPCFLLKKANKNKIENKSIIDMAI